MDFTFSDEQEMLRSSARDFLAQRYPIERVAEMADWDGFDREGWAAAVQMGWTGISVPEEDGGAGLGFLEEMLVAEETGRLDKELVRIAASYESDLDRQLRMLVSVAEPLLLMCMASIIGTIVVGMLLPLFNLQDVMK